MLVESRLVASDDDQVSHPETSRRDAGTGRGFEVISESRPRGRTGPCREEETAARCRTGQRRGPAPVFLPVRWRRSADGSASCTRRWSLARRSRITLTQVRPAHGLVSCSSNSASAAGTTRRISTPGEAFDGSWARISVWCRPQMVCVVPRSSKGRRSSSPMGRPSRSHHAQTTLIPRPSSHAPRRSSEQFRSPHTNPGVVRRARCEGAMRPIEDVLPEHTPRRPDGEMAAPGAPVRLANARSSVSRAATAASAGARIGSFDDSGGPHGARALSRGVLCETVSRY